MSCFFSEYLAFSDHQASPRLPGQLHTSDVILKLIARVAASCGRLTQKVRAERSRSVNCGSDLLFIMGETRIVQEAFFQIGSNHAFDDRLVLCV
jgi:hypothetical protein